MYYDLRLCDRNTTVNKVTHLFNGFSGHVLHILGLSPGFNTLRKSKLNSLNEKDEKFTERILSLENTVESLEEHMGKKLDLMNKSNAVLYAQVQAMSQRLTTLEKQGTHRKLL